MQEFDLKEAESRLLEIESRKKYISKLLTYVNKCVEDGSFEQALNYITCVADNLIAVNGAIAYIHLTDFGRCENEQI